ncbi:MAG: efflux RND transporter permease subunit [Pseudomonadota bacterium]
MVLSDLSVKRPIVAAVMSIVIVLCGFAAYDQLPLRQFPDIDPPVVSIDTNYPGAAANVVESRVTEPIEARIAGLEGIDTIESASSDGASRITVSFRVGRDVDAAANDVRDRVAGVLDDLPPETDPPEISKVDSNQDVIMWLNLTSDRLTVPELTDYARRYLVDRFSVLDGVSRVRVGGQQNFALRIWLDRKEMAARGVAVSDIEERLRAENVELPAGSLESSDRQLTVRVNRSFTRASDFENLALQRGEEGYLLRLGDVARVEFGAEEDRTFFRGNGVPQVGIGVIRQSTANTIDVAQGARDLAERLNPTLPEGMAIRQSYDTSVFIQGAIDEVYKTLGLAVLLVVLTILLFLRSWRAMLAPAVTVPVSLVGAFLAMWLLGFSINLLTLLALVLAIGLVVDDAIVVLENIVRRMDELGETPMVAAYRGSRQVAFAVIATTIVLVAVFTPIGFLQGDIGRLFSEFALTIAAAVVISSFVALSLTPALAAALLRRRDASAIPTDGAGPRGPSNAGRGPAAARRLYGRMVDGVIRAPAIGLALIAASAGAAAWLFQDLPSEYAPREDRGAFFVIVNGPEGATYNYMLEYMDEIERRLTPYVESGEFQRLLVRAPRSFSTFEEFNSGIVIVVLSDWAERRSAWPIMGEVRQTLGDLPGVRAFPIMRQGFGGRTRKPLQMTIGGGDWEQLAEWRDTLLDALATEGVALNGLDWDYKETKPQLRVEIDYDRAAELGVRIRELGQTLETMLGSRRVTTFLQEGEEYDVILEGERDSQRTPNDLSNIYVRSTRSDALIPLSNVVELREVGGSGSLNRYNRIRAITLEATPPDGVALGDALARVEAVARQVLPPEVVIDFKGQSRDLRETGDSIAFVFVFGLAVVFLALAAQFESWRHPAVILLSAPTAIGGGLAGLWLAGGTLNIFSQIGMVMLVGLSAKNGILIVEFANQLRDQGREFGEAIREAALTRLRPVVMTGVTTAAGALPLILASGAGAESRFAIGAVVLGGVIGSTALTLFTVPAAYALVARGSGSPGRAARRLEAEEKALGPAVTGPAE